MADIVNLRTVRKRKLRDTRLEEAAQNRARHGRPLNEKQRDRQEAARRKQLLDGHFRSGTDGESD